MGRIGLGCLPAGGEPNCAGICQVATGIVGYKTSLVIKCFIPDSRNPRLL